MTILFVLAGVWLAVMIVCVGVSRRVASQGLADRLRRVGEAMNYAGSGIVFLPMLSSLLHEPPTWLRLVIYALFAGAPLMVFLELRSPKRDWLRALYALPYHSLGLAALVASWKPSTTLFVAVAMGSACILLLLRLGQGLFRGRRSAEC